MGTAGWIILAVIVVVVIVLVMIYNRLVSLNQRATQSWSDISVQLKQRHDLIPNLVETVKGYAAHEKSTLDAVIQARNQAQAAATPPDAAAADNALTGALKSVFALAEAYPDLKANQNFLDLQETLTATEDKIAYARQFYNDTVKRYNTKIETVPTSVLAGAFHFTERQYFEAGGAARGPVDVSF